MECGPVFGDWDLGSWSFPESWFLDLPCGTDGVRNVMRDAWLTGLKSQIANRKLKGGRRKTGLS